ncbi:MAG: spore coat associated protein CotJA [Oscillospiraceae bacterium]|nr:spore coat associated protein CotJA [Oscillospiraceae bacterium]
MTKNNFQNQRPYYRFDERERVSCDMSLPSLPADAAIAMAYVPFQTDTTMYDEIMALDRGTVFPACDKPFLAAGDRR